MLKSETIDGAGPYDIHAPQGWARSTDDSVGQLLEERGSQWGDASITHARIAEVWSGILNVEVTAHQVALCMTGLKLVRAAINPDDPDSLDDAEGYVRIGKKVMGR